MSKLVPVLLSVFVLLIAALACVMPGVTTPDLNDPSFINTAIAQTHSVAASQTALMIPVTGPDTPTPTRASSATPFPTFTPVVFSTPEARVSINTNCRIGPGNVYAVVGILQAGEAAQVVGRSADGNFWAIRNPDRPGEICWIPDQDTTISGFTNLLPVFTPPPTVTPTRTQIPVLATATRTRTSVPVFPPARTATQTSPPPATPTGVPSLSPTGASRFTLTPTDPASPSPTPTGTSTPSETPTPSSTPTPTVSATPTDLTLISPTPSLTSTGSPTPTDTSTPSQTPTDSSTATPTTSATPTDPSFISPTPSSTDTPTPSATATDLLSLSSTPTDTATPSQTATPSSTSTATPTETSTPSQTLTPTPTITGTLSETPTPSSTSTPTPTVTGTLSQTPTPTVTGTLTPGFTISYSGLESCPELGWWMDFQVSNTGTIPFETMSLTVSDPSTGTSRTLLSNDFTNRNGCGTATTLDTFDPGVTHILSSAAFTYDPSGHQLTARITLCANPGPNGECVTQDVDFTP